MEDEADVGLVDPHAEGNGCHYHDAWFGHEDVLVPIALCLVHAGVIGQGENPLLAEKGGRRFGLFPRQAIDDSAHPAMAFDEREQLGFPVALHLHRQLYVRAVEAKDDGLRVAGEQLRRDVLAGDLVGRCRQRRGGNAGEDLPQAGEALVFGAEGGTPLRDAVGLVDGDQADVEPSERRQHALGHQPFRRHVEEPRLARGGAPPRGDVVGAVARRVDGIGRDAGETQCRHLIAHQGHQRRDDDGDAALDQRRHLKAKRLAGPRRHDGQHVSPGQQRVHRLLLPGTEIVEAEDLLQDPSFFVAMVPGWLHRTLF